MKYCGRLFELDGRWYSWQLMFDGEGPLCARYSSFGSGHKDKEKSIRVPRPAMTQVEIGVLNTLFKTFHLCKKDQKAIINICLRKKWDEDAEKMCEKLAKADWEKYRRSKSK